MFFRERLLSLGPERTLFVYTSFADLRSFSRMAKCVLDRSPEPRTPTLIAVSILFPGSLQASWLP